MAAKLLRDQIDERIAKLYRQEENLYDLAADDDGPKVKLRARLAKIAGQRAKLEEQLEHSDDSLEVGAALLEAALALLKNPEEFYRQSGPKFRRILNQAIFEKLYVFEDEVTEHVLREPFAEMHEAETVIGAGNENGVGKRRRHRLVIERFVELGSDGCREVVAESDRAVVPFDRVFDVFDLCVTSRAVSSRFAATEEIEVLAAVANSSLHEKSALLALTVTPTAPNTALEVMRVLAQALARGGPRLEHFLDSLKEFFGDEGLVATLVQLAVVLDDPAVVRVTQHGLNLRCRDRSRRVAAWTRDKTTIRERRLQTIDGVLAGGAQDALLVGVGLIHLVPPFVLGFVVLGDDAVFVLGLDALFGVMVSGSSSSPGAGPRRLTPCFLASRWA